MQETTIHTHSSAYTHVIAKPALPCHVETRRNRQEIRQKKMKENKMMPPWKGLLPQTILQCMGLKTGVSIVDEKGKEERRKQKNEARRLPEGSRVESNSASATQATRIEKRVEDEITDVKKAKKDEEEQEVMQWRSQTMRRIILRWYDKINRGPD
ncbi:hypothetical protein B0H14DRAFT_2565653 [Mycena olivaceomarginata]|nr:hypothetical protein B0H14DRAFT_2565653 [Mycena olivaceomarginata]